MQRNVNIQNSQTSIQNQEILTSRHHNLGKSLKFLSDVNSQFQAYTAKIPSILEQISAVQVFQLSKKYKFFLKKMYSLEDTKADLMRKYSRLEQIQDENPLIRTENQSIHFIKMMTEETHKKLELIQAKVKQEKQKKREALKTIQTLKQAITIEKNRFFNLKRQLLGKQMQKNSKHQANKLAIARKTFQSIIADKLNKKRISFLPSQKREQQKWQNNQDIFKAIKPEIIMDEQSQKQSEIVPIIKVIQPNLNSYSDSPGVGNSSIIANILFKEESIDNQQSLTRTGEKCNIKKQGKYEDQNKIKMKGSNIKKSLSLKANQQNKNTHIFSKLSKYSTNHNKSLNIDQQGEMDKENNTISKSINPDFKTCTQNNRTNSMYSLQKMAHTEVMSRLIGTELDNCLDGENCKKKWKLSQAKFNSNRRRMKTQFGKLYLIHKSPYSQQTPPFEQTPAPTNPKQSHESLHEQHLPHNSCTLKSKECEACLHRLDQIRLDQQKFSLQGKDVAKLRQKLASFGHITKPQQTLKLNSEHRGQSDINGQFRFDREAEVRNREKKLLSGDQTVRKIRVQFRDKQQFLELGSQAILDKIMDSNMLDKVLMLMVKENMGMTKKPNYLKLKL